MGAIKTNEVVNISQLAQNLGAIKDAFAVAPHPVGNDYYQECHYESMIYSRAYQAGIYTRDRMISIYKPKVVSRAIRNANRLLRKKSEPRTEANLKVKLTPHHEEQSITKSMTILELASMQEAVDYEIERAKLNSKLSLSMHNQPKHGNLNINQIPMTRKS